MCAWSALWCGRRSATGCRSETTTVLVRCRAECGQLRPGPPGKGRDYRPESAKTQTGTGFLPIFSPHVLPLHQVDDAKS
jgi:hypothetical protein